MLSDPTTANLKIFKAEEGREPDLDNPADLQALEFVQKGFMVGVFSFHEYAARLPEPASDSDPKFFYFAMAQVVFKAHMNREADLNQMPDLRIVSYIHVGIEHARRHSLRKEESK